MNQFSDFGIKQVDDNLTGDKIKIGRILNKQVVIEKALIKDSKFEGKGKCLHLQIEMNGARHVVFTSGKKLIDAIEKVPPAGFPFTTIIVLQDERLQFT